MKILMVAIPNHHFFQWVNQLEASGFEVYWFDITASGNAVDRINWVKQIRNWKLKIKFPFRIAIKKNFPRLYHLIQKCNENNVAVAFQKVVDEIQPDVVHCFEMTLTGLPILNVMEKHSTIKLVYSSWGSDMFYFTEMNVKKESVTQFLNRVDFLITDCKRDYNIALKNGFKNTFLGVFPVNGGITIDTNEATEFENRNNIIIKGYEDGVGKAIMVLEALKKVQKKDIEKYNIVVFSADAEVKKMLQNDAFFQNLNVEIFERNHFLPNSKLLAIMQKSLLYIGNSISDGMPNTLLEAMGTGVFPIQSNPGNVTQEVIEHGKNGFIIDNPLDTDEIAQLITDALSNEKMRQEAYPHNIEFIEKNYNRKQLKSKIVDVYQHQIMK